MPPTEGKKYPAKMTAYGIKENERGPRFWVEFEISDEGKPMSVFWSGTVGSDAAKNRTFKGLIEMGLKGNDLALVQGGIMGGALNKDVPYTVTLQKESYVSKKSGHAVESWTVKYVNTPNDPKFQVATDKMKSDLKAFTADVMAVRASLGVPSKTDDFDPKL